MANTGFLIDGVDEFDSIFERYTPPYGQGSPVGYIFGVNDLRTRYLQFSQLGNFFVDTSGGTQLSVATQSITTDYEHIAIDLKKYFPAQGSVKYGIVVPVTSNQQNLDVQAYVQNYLQVNFPSFYDTSYTYFNSNNNTGAGFSTSNPSIILWIQSGVVVYSNTTGAPAMTCSAFPSGVFVKILNDGTIAGCGGGGGNLNGGTAITLASNVIIDNGSGDIWGGGGSGQPGGPAICQGNTVDVGSYSIVYPGGPSGNGASSAGGVLTAAGTGNHGFTQMGLINPCNVNNVTGYYSEWGGNGGTWGVAGDSAYNTNGPIFTTNYETVAGPGSGGNAIITNGYTITWLSGSSFPNVQGDVV